MCNNIIAVGGGKGGVGKSIIAANLAIAAAQNGASVVLVDADLGAANLHTLFGIAKPKRLLEHFIGRAVENLDGVLTDTELPNLKVICGGMPVLGTANPKHAQKQRLLRHLTYLPVDLVVLDIGAGASFNVLDLFNASSAKLVVFTPQLTSLHNGYGFLKAAVIRKIQQTVSAPSKEILEEDDPLRGHSSLKRRVEMIAAADPEEATEVTRLLDGYNAFVVGNMLQTSEERNVLSAMSRMIGDHLGLAAPVLGTLKRGNKVEASVNQRRPFMLSAGIEGNAEAFREMAARLVAAGSVVHDTASPKAAPPAAVSTGAHERRHPRFETNLGALLVSGRTRAEGVVRNISEGGALVEFERRIPAPAGGRLVLQHLGEPGAVMVAVEERHRDPAGRTIGFRFLDLDQGTRVAVRHMVDTSHVSTAIEAAAAV